MRERTTVDRRCPACGKLYPGSQQHVCEKATRPVKEGEAEAAFDVADPEALVGAVLGSRYEILEPVGAGGMGIVYKARHTVLESLVAVKVLLREQDEEAERRFLLEAKLASKLHHPNTVHISDFGVLADGRSYLVMEYLQGPTLSLEIDKERLDPLRACRIALQIVHGLLAVHGQGIVHRDLKPANIFLLTEGGQTDCVKIVDFGIAYARAQQGPSPERPREAPASPLQKVRRGSSDELAKTMDGAKGGAAEAGEPAARPSLGPPSGRHTLPGTVLGTPHYMPPEQIRGEEVDERSDQYALGCILYEMLTGSVPFEADNLAKVMQLHLSGQVQPLHARLPSLRVPASLESLVMRMLAKLPGNRFASLIPVEQALQRVIEVLQLQRGEKMTLAPASAVDLRNLSSGSLPVMKHPQRRRWLLPVAILVPMFAVLVFLGGALVQRRSATKSQAVNVPRVFDQLQLRQRAVEVLRKQLADVDSDVRLGALAALSQVGDPTLRPFIEPLLSDPSSEVRAQAAATLGQLGDRRALASLRALLERQENQLPRVRLAAAEALTLLEDPEGPRILQSALHSDDDEARQKAAFLLSERGHPQALSILEQLAVQPGLPPAMSVPITARLAQAGDGRARARMQAQLTLPLEQSLPVAARLAQLGDEQGRAFLRTAAQREGPHQLLAARFLASPEETAVAETCRRVLRSTQASLPARLLATEALGLAGQLSDAQLLGESLAEPASLGEPRLGRAMALAVLLILGRQPDALSEQSLRWAQSAMSETDWIVRGSAAVVLGDVQDPKAVPLLATLMRDRDARVRVRAAQALARSASQGALTALRGALKDEDAEVRQASIRALLQAGELLEVRGARALLDEVGGWLRALVSSGAIVSKEQALLSMMLLRTGDDSQRLRLREALRSTSASLRQFLAEQLVDAELLHVALADPLLSVRLPAARTLAGRGDQRAAPVLREALEKGGLEAVAAYGLLRKLGESPAAPKGLSLDAQLKSEQVETRRAAVETLAALSPEQAVPILWQAARDPDPSVRQRVADLAGELSGGRGEPAQSAVLLLRRLQLDSDLVVRLRASALLTRRPRPQLDAEKPPAPPPAIKTEPVPPAAPPPSDGVMATDPVLELIARGKQAYAQHDLGKAQKLFEKAHLQCGRARRAACTAQSFEIGWQLGRIFEEQRMWPEAIREYDRLLSQPLSVPLDAVKKSALTEAVARLKPRVGRVVVHELVNGKCQATSLWTLPGTISVNLGETSEDVQVRLNQTVEVGPCR